MKRLIPREKFLAQNRQYIMIGKVYVNFKTDTDKLKQWMGQVYPISSLDENYDEFELQADQNYYVNWRQIFLALKLKLIEGRCYWTYITKEVNKERAQGWIKRRCSKKDGRLGNGGRSSILQFLRLLMWMRFCIQFFPMLRCTSTIGKFLLISIVCAQILHLQQFQGSHLRVQETLNCESYNCEESPAEKMDAPLSEHFFKKTMKMLTRPDGFTMCGNLGLKFSPFLGCCIQIW